MNRPIMFIALLGVGHAGGAETALRLAGRVVSETNAPVAGARILLRCPSGLQQAVSEPTGGFVFAQTESGCRISVERDGFFPLLNQNYETPGKDGELRLVLSPVRELLQSTDVVANRTAIDLETASTQESVTGTEILNVPFPATNNLKNAMRIIPGVVQGNRGGLHINGGGSEQTSYSLDGFNIADPLTNTFETRLSVEAVQTVEVTSGAITADYGKGSAGTLAIRSRTGDDRFRASATNFIPGFELRKGLIVGNFTPRVNFSGPWKRGRAWFSDSLDLQYDQNVVPELPKGMDRTHSWRGSNLLSNQINLSPSNILQIGLLTTFYTAPQTGLSALDPAETTIDRRSRQWFANIKDQIYFTRGALLEFGFASNRTFAREIPQGPGEYLITPWGKRGNWYRNSTQQGGRDQFLANGFLPTFSWFGSHQIKVGIDLNRVRYWQCVERTGLTQFRADGTPMRSVVFDGTGSLSRNNLETSTYVQDQWRVRPGIMVDAGLRLDWDHLVRRTNVSPRLGLAWSPARHENTKISGGAGIIYDASNLSLFTRPNDQFPVATYFEPGGPRGPYPSLFLAADQRLRNNGVITYNGGIEQRVWNNVHLRLNYLGKRGLKGLTYLNVLPPESGMRFDAIYRLRNQRQDRYDGVEVTVRQSFRGQYEWLTSYVRSSARSNAAVDISADELYLIANNSGPMAWDTPHRFLSWGYLPTPWKNWAVAYLTEWRSGFPFSVVGENGEIDGAVNSRRYPTFFETNLHLEWKFGFRKAQWALRGGVNNITNRHNPIVVNNLMGTPNYLSYYGGFGRSLNFRIRWLGRLP